jgi:hypothetical protein
VCECGGANIPACCHCRRHPNKTPRCHPLSRRRRRISQIRFHSLSPAAYLLATFVCVCARDERERERPANYSVRKIFFSFLHFCHTAPLFALEGFLPFFCFKSIHFLYATTAATVLLLMRQRFPWWAPIHFFLCSCA